MSIFTVEYWIIFQKSFFGGNILRFYNQILVIKAVATNISANNLNVVKHFLLVIENIFAEAERKYFVFLTCYDDPHCVMNPALTISGNTSVVWQVAVRDSANGIIFLDF